ncbi:uncharacterized protein LAESUDRAFT_472760 [Laetiporus sulphureus 93-53]|uniref:Uncharacterized protein n=1 Tax=Laetiporus sulphureus 93-53 TaxID=1314785 RepID=A0A165GBM0_9APHY|nr:uncharacterized protein LAESUDRAFT_472760 [Laetiporus sulphureus 93-53]KZT10119.1 hypothetical protein LAESUDRAFT_472760 [Laetiporus sulphureus 93-53]
MPDCRPDFRLGHCRIVICITLRHELPIFSERLTVRDAAYCEVSQRWLLLRTQVHTPTQLHGICDPRLPSATEYEASQLPVHILRTVGRSCQTRQALGSLHMSASTSRRFAFGDDNLAAMHALSLADAGREAQEKMSGSGWLRVGGDDELLRLEERAAGHAYPKASQMREVPPDSTDYCLLLCPPHVGAERTSSDHIRKANTGDMMYNCGCVRAGRYIEWRMCTSIAPESVPAQFQEVRVAYRQCRGSTPIHVSGYSAISSINVAFVESSGGHTPSLERKARRRSGREMAICIT